MEKTFSVLKEEVLILLQELIERKEYLDGDECEITNQDEKEGRYTECLLSIMRVQQLIILFV